MLVCGVLAVCWLCVLVVCDCVFVCWLCVTVCSYVGVTLCSYVGVTVCSHVGVGVGVRVVRVGRTHVACMG